MGPLGGGHLTASFATAYQSLLKPLRLSARFASGCRLTAPIRCAQSACICGVQVGVRFPAKAARYACSGKVVSSVTRLVCSAVRALEDPSHQTRLELQAFAAMACYMMKVVLRTAVTALKLCSPCYRNYLDAVSDLAIPAVPCSCPPAVRQQPSCQAAP
jgi:hypothetical protein